MKRTTSNIRFLTVGFILIGFFSACSPHIARDIQKTYSALDDSAEVKVINIGETIPFRYEALGTITLEDAGVTSKSRCTYEALLALAIEEAKKVGGNAIKITKSIPPGWQKGGPGISHGAGVSVRASYQQCHTLSVLILKTVEEN
jgi:hypothetical protein